MTLKKPKFGALPTINMPQKSITARPIIPRKPRSIVKDYSQDFEKKRAIYKDFGELCKRVQSPYTSTEDPRFAWLEGEFLQYLNDWKQSTLDRPGNYTANARSRMFLSWQTYEGLQITTYSVIEATKFLLQEGMEYVLTERFCQDPIEEYFGSQRKIGRRSDNPDIKMFGYNDNTIRIQRSVSCQSGNTRGRKDRKKAWVEVTDEPLPKRKEKTAIVTRTG